MPDKLTDTKTYNPCDDCSHSFSRNNQESNVCKMCELKYYIDKVNRLQADYESLKQQEEKAHQYCKNECETKYKSQIQSLQAENERLREEIKDYIEDNISLLYEVDNATINMPYQIKSIKAEAYKEFAERLKEKGIKVIGCNAFDKVIPSNEIDNLLKELVGDT